MKKLRTDKRNRYYQIGVILNENEYDAISADAEATGLTRSAYCRMVLIAEHNKKKEEK